MVCIVCGGYVTRKRASNNSSDMFCSAKCRIDWCTKLHFVKVSWKVPTWAHAHAHTGGVQLGQLKTYFIK